MDPSLVSISNGWRIRVALWRRHGAHHRRSQPAKKTCNSLFLLNFPISYVSYVLAVWMGQTVDGGTFRTRVGAARMFGLVETSAGRVTVTQLGRDVLDKSGVERAARVTAFLNVELFQALYDQNKGHPLPPLPAIERQIEGLGVSPKQKERARQTFNKSAIYAGFY